MMNVRFWLRVALLGVVLPAVPACTGVRYGEPLDSGAVANATYTASPAVVDGVNGTLFELKVPAIDQFGDTIMAMDPKSGEMRKTYARFDYKFVSDEPIGGEIIKITWSTATDFLAGWGLSELTSCKGDNCGGDVQVINLSNAAIAQAKAGAQVQKGVSY